VSKADSSSYHWSKARQRVPKFYFLVICKLVTCFFHQVMPKRIPTVTRRRKIMILLLKVSQIMLVAFQAARVQTKLACFC